MELRRLGKTDMQVSEMCLGCWAMGGSLWGGARDQDSLASIKAAVNAGINFIDTAQGYGAGHSEELIGQALAGSDAQVVVATKSFAHQLTSDKFLETIDACRSRLRRDCIDLFYIHWPMKKIPLEEPIENLMKAREKGLIRSVGVSNFSLEQLEQAVKIAEITALQPPLNILWPFAQEDLIPFCAEHDIAVAVYSPIARGLLTGKFTKGWEFLEGDSRPNDVLFKSGNFEKCLDVVEKIKPIAAKYGKSVGQLAINWAASRAGVTSAIVGVRSVDQLNDNLGAVGWRINPDDEALIEETARPLTDSLRKYPNPFDVSF